MVQLRFDERCGAIKDSGRERVRWQRDHPIQRLPRKRPVVPHPAHRKRSRDDRRTPLSTPPPGDGLTRPFPDSWVVLRRGSRTVVAPVFGSSGPLQPQPTAGLPCPATSTEQGQP
ncbi:hypothetical protein BHE74_00030049 [Ensete ventricosum]|nr:hypothetical protein GW17_00031780 [Ensete ventricosum]RWW62808.1 hypothetical protein BHE74_00030049 [Ensete ventricosum]